MLWQQLNDPENPENKNAGNGGDLCKHTVYLAVVDYLLTQPPWSENLRIRECHAGRGMYRVPTEARRSLLECLYRPIDSKIDVLLHDEQRASQTALSVWPGQTSAVQWYSGSAVLNAWRLGDAETGNHLLELYEYAPDTRAILRALFASPALSLPRVSVRVLPEPERSGSFDGEVYIENNVSKWNSHDLILLDPFAMWRQTPDQLRRSRYRRIVEKVIALGDDSPMFILFWTWGRAFPVAEGDLDGTQVRVKDGYQDLRDLLHRANRRILRVTWRWELQFAMWIVVADSHVEELCIRIQRQCAELSRHLQTHGYRMSSPEIDVIID